LRERDRLADQREGKRGEKEKKYFGDFRPLKEQIRYFAR
jgi:hypothetical protein